MNYGDAPNEELAELAELMAATVLHRELAMTVSACARRFRWDRQTTAHVVRLAGEAYQRGCEVRLQRNRGRRPVARLETAGGASGEALISSYYRIGLQRPRKKRGHPWLTFDESVKTLLTRNAKRTNRNDRGDGNARQRAREYLVGWLESHYWMHAHLSEYGFGCPLPG